MRAEDYAKEYGYKPNEQGYVCLPPDDIGNNDVDIILTGNNIENPNGYEVKGDQNPLRWDWSRQGGVMVSFYRISKIRK